MNIKIQYTTEAEDTAKASIIFLETKTFFWFVISMVNLLAIVIVLGGFLALIQFGSQMFQLLPLMLMCILWLWFRRKATVKFLRWRLQKQPVIGKDLAIEISKNGIVWHGQGLKDGHMNWRQLNYLIATRTGYVLPTTATKFLWIPLSGFVNPQETKTFEQFCQERNVRIKRIKWKL